MTTAPGWVIFYNVVQNDLNDTKSTLMNIRKSACILLTLLLGLGLFTSGAVAKSGCNDRVCTQMLMGGSHHSGKSMARSLISDCCAGPHKVPCEFEPGRKKASHPMSISSGRVENSHFASAADKVSSALTQDRLPFGYMRLALPSYGHATPIYLQNQTLIV